MELEELYGMTPSELEHYGVPGMRWGVRRTEEQLARARAKREGKAKARKEYQEKKPTTKKAVKSKARELSMVKELSSKKMEALSDSELKEKTDRLRMENDLKRLTNSPTKHVTRKGKLKLSEYYDRDKLDNNQLKERVKRLQMEDNFKKQIKGANRETMKKANSAIKRASSMALDSFADEKGNFSATGNDTADIIIRETLKWSKDKNVLK